MKKRTKIHRLNLRLPAVAIEKIEQLQQQGLGDFTYNSWIAQAINEKFERDRICEPTSPYKNDRVLAEEGGRTTRGNIAKMRAYVDFLNAASSAGTLDFEQAERYWIAKVEAFFASKPLKLRIDPQLGMRAVVRKLLDEAKKRQSMQKGATFVGTVMQHLVGAKLSIVLAPNVSVKHHSANQSDQNSTRTADFDIGDVSIHVTNSPSESLIAKCRENLQANRKPIVVTSAKGVVLADGLAENAGIAESLDIIEIEQFIATNVHELGRFANAASRGKVKEIVEKYNEIVGSKETDPGLMIEIATGK